MPVSHTSDWMMALLQSVSEGCRLPISVCDQASDPTCSFCLLWLQFAIKPSALFHCNFVIICVLLWCFTDEADNLSYMDQTYTCVAFAGSFTKSSITVTHPGINQPASVAQLDAPSDWRPGGRGFNPRRVQQHSFVEIDHEIFSTVILSLPLFKKSSCQFLVKECAQYWLTA